ncbi:unnamed protein product [Ilex paraguariensis]|uniref:Uncharacterized protein n=1 Tax=Ilex paraguariensis TaxID=185542 RepID=A0ABC8SWF1_9AQUA
MIIEANFTDVPFHEDTFVFKRFGDYQLDFQDQCRLSTDHRTSKRFWSLYRDCKLNLLPKRIILVFGCGVCTAFLLDIEHYTSSGALSVNFNSLFFPIQA